MGGEVTYLSKDDVGCDSGRLRKLTYVEESV
jgi:hypothetical protein